MNLLLRYILCIVLLAASSQLKAQKKNSPIHATVSTKTSNIWTRRIARLIDTRDSLDTKGHVHKRIYGDTLFAHTLIMAVLNNRITPYELMSSTLRKRLSLESVKAKLNPAPNPPKRNRNDSSYIALPRNDSYFPDLTTYKILEEWTFDPIKRETEIHIAGVGILRNTSFSSRYHRDDEIFWVKWQDVQLLINGNLNKPAYNSMQQSLWDTYYKYPGLSVDSSYVPPSFTEKTRTRLAIRNIETIDTGAWTDGRIFDENDFWIIAQSFYDSINANKLAAYSDTKLNSPDILPFSSIALPQKLDTVLITRDNEDIYQVRAYDTNWDWFCNYDLLEKWSFDAKNGQIDIRILGIKPRFDIQNSHGLKIPYNKLFWVRYNDVFNIINEYDKCHPVNGLSMSLWKSYLK